GAKTLGQISLAPIINLDFNALSFDQRGAPFARDYDGDGNGNTRIDMGAYERQPIPPAAFGDYNLDGFVDAADYTVWSDTLGAAVPAATAADGNGSGNVDVGDLDVWKEHFGASIPVVTIGGSGSVAEDASHETTGLLTLTTVDAPSAVAISL